MRTASEPLVGVRVDADPPNGSVERRRRVDGATLVQLLALVPILLTFKLVHESSQLQWLDYWQALTRFTGASRTPHPLHLFFYHEGDVPAIGSLVLWLNLQLFHGLAHPVGYFDLAVVVGQLLILRSLLPSPERLGRWWYAGLVVAIAVLLFAPQGAWNFSRSASGASWL